MGKIESFIVGMFLCFVIPAGLFFPAWWLSVFFLPEKAVPFAALSGLFIGVLLDVVFVRRWTKRVYFLNNLTLTMIYLLLSLIGFAICMGVPIFHPLLGILAGIYVGRKLHYLQSDGNQLRHAVKRAAIFTAAVMCLICIFSATIAFLNPTTPAELQRMFNLPFDVTWQTVILLVLVGGSTLVAFQYWATIKAAGISFRMGDIVKKV